MENTTHTPEPGTEEQDPVTPQADPEQETPQTPPVEQPEGQQPDGQEPEQPAPQEPQQPDWKKKATEQGKENILINARLDQERTRNAQLTSKDAPNDDEMRALYANWDELDDNSKSFYRNQRLVEKRAARAEQTVLTLAERIEFDERLDDFLETPPDQFTKLRGREAEFKRFAKKKDNTGLPLDTLAKAFLFDAEEEPQQAPNRTPGLERGSGGPRTAPKPRKISLEEAAQIRKTDYKRYMELVRTGQIEEDIE
ncbi:MAG: hypothetical protein AB7U82_01165 [Blastocatellales bacterium]